MSILYDYSWMKATTVLAKCPGLTKRQLDWWVRARYVTPDVIMPGRGFERKFRKREFARIRYMNILVNQLHFPPDKAAIYATAACEMMVVRNGRVWLTVNDVVVIGLPIFDDMVKEKSA